MAQINQHIIWSSIKDLLYKHDCVIVPDFGGFVCNPEQARIDQISHVITPPGKRIVFNQNLKVNDGLLAQHIAGKLAVTYSEALTSIGELVNNLRVHLENIKHLDIDTFGSFRLNAEANYVFLPDKHNNFLYSSFGLMPLQAIPVNGQHRGVKQTRIFKDRKEVREARRMARAKYIGLKMLAATLIIMLCVNGYIYLTDSHLIGGARINTTGINSWFDSLMNSNDEPEVKEQTPTVITEPETPVEENIAPAPVAEIITDSISEETIPQNNIGLNLAEVFASLNKTAPEIYNQPEEIPEQITENPASNELPETVDVKETVVVAPSESSAKYSYHVIGGVFCKEINARRFYNKLKEEGFEAELLLNTRINCNRVSYRKVYSLEEAIALMDSLKKTSSNPEAWVLTVKEK